jgi:adenine-specific DNA-methyltransferase
LLADNGTLFWYGDAKRIAYTQIVFDKYFELLNSLVWENTNPHKQQIRFSEDLRSFAPLTERILMYDKGEDKSGLYAINANLECFKSIKVYLDQEHEKTGLSLKQMCQQYGSTCSHYFGFSTREKEQFAIPTKEKYELLQSTGHFRKDYEDLRREYEDLRREYEDLSTKTCGARLITSTTSAMLSTSQTWKRTSMTIQQSNPRNSHALLFSHAAL